MSQTTRPDHGIHIQQKLSNSPSRPSAPTYSSAQVHLPSPPPSPTCTISHPFHHNTLAPSPSTPTRSAALLLVNLSRLRSPPRCRPSVGVSLLCHAPVSSTAMMLHVPRATSPALLPPSRPLSPSSVDHPPRPSSRSEYLLRDTLRRADDHERRQGGSSPFARSPRGRSNGYMGPVGSSDEPTVSRSECDEDTDTHALSRSGPSFDYLLRIPPVTVAPRPVRRRSTSRASRGAPDAAFYPYGSPSSPSPMPPMLPRTRTESAILTQKGLMSSLDQLGPLPSSAAQSQLHVQVHGRTLRTSRPPSSHSQSRTSSVDTSPRLRPTNLSSVSPHEAVLRARLEGVLKKASTQVAEEQDNEAHSPQATHRRTKSHSPTTDQGQTVIADWTSSSDNSSRQSLDGLPLTSPTGPRKNVKSGYTQSQRGQGLGGKFTSPPSPDEPITPPSTPPFNARSASELCRRMDGYVSFANIEGLGEPPEIDVEGDMEGVGPGMKGWIKRLRWPFGVAGHGADIATDENDGIEPPGLIVNSNLASPRWRRDTT